MNSDHWQNLLRSKIVEDSDLSSFRQANGQDQASRLSFGLDDQGTSEEFDALVNEALQRYKLDKIVRLIGSTYGKPTLHEFSCDDKHLKSSFNDIYLICYFLEIEKFLDPNESINIIEIGGGYGGLAEKWLNNRQIRRYVLCDLPQILKISSTYLKNVLTDQEYNKITFATPFEIHDIDLSTVNDSRTVFINTRSFMEMRRSVVGDYFSAIHFLSKPGDIFFQANRYSKMMSGDNVCIRDYPYDNLWDLLAISNSVNQPYICQVCTIRRSFPDKAYATANVIKRLPQHLFYKDSLRAYIKMNLKKLFSIFSLNKKTD